MTRKKTKFCLSWPNKTLKISCRLQNITILLTERTIMPCSNLILPLSALFYRMWRHFLLDDSDTQKVPGGAECSPPPLSETYNDRRCPVTKEYPNKVPWSLIKRCTRLSTCSSEIIEQSVISSSPCNVYVQLCMFGVFCLCSTPSYNRPPFVQNRAGAGT